MQGLLDTIQQWHIHPVVDHFTVAVLILAVATDLLASLFSTRQWLRYAALALIVVGVAAAWGSNLTGGWEAHKVRDAVKAAGGLPYDVLRRHAWLGDWLPWVFSVLVLWRIGVQLFGFMARTRALYLLVAVLAVIVLSYQGYLGGEMVYDFGVGTTLFPGATPTPSPQAEATGPATPVPTVYVPTAVPTATMTPEATTPSSSSNSAGATVSATPNAAAVPSPSQQPTASPTAASSTSKAGDTTTSAAPAVSPETTIRPPDPPGAASL